MTTSATPDPASLVGRRREEAQSLLAAAGRKVTIVEVTSARPPRPAGPWYVVRARTAPDGRIELSVVPSRALAPGPAA